MASMSAFDMGSTAIGSNVLQLCGSRGCSAWQSCADHLGDVIALISDHGRNEGRLK